MLEQENKNLENEDKAVDEEEKKNENESSQDQDQAQESSKKKDKVKDTMTIGEETCLTPIQDSDRKGKSDQELYNLINKKVNDLVKNEYFK